MDHTSFTILLDRYLAGTCSPQEQLQLEAWLEQQEVEVNEWTTMDTAAKAAWMASLYQDIRLSIATTAQPEQAQEPRVIPFYRRTFFRVAAAAVIMLLVGSIAYLYYKRAPKNEAVIVKKEQAVPQDVAPGSNKAILTLADNSTIMLDSAANGTLAKQGKTTVIKSGDGKLVYDAKALPTAHSPVSYNTLATPRGGQYQLVLPDGSKVWLNAASSIRYPTAFTGNERKVEITGEAYFEIKPLTPKGEQKKMPFVVKIVTPKGDGGEVEVLGTHFNINAYDDEPVIKTTLLEGSVKISKDAASALLKPGAQAQLNRSGQIKISDDADVDEAMAWKNGIFKFKEADLPTVVRQLQRWYNIEVVYEKEIPALHFGGDISRNSNLSQVLKILEISGVHARIEERKMIISM